MNTSAFARRPEGARIGTVVAAADEVGLAGVDDTAVVFHDLDLLDDRLDELRATFPDGTLHAVAIKANPLVEVLRHVVARGGGLEAASIEEVHLAVAAGCPPDRIVFDSPAKTRTEIATALDLGIRVNADNLDELDRIAELVGDTSPTSVVGLRVNPLVGAGSIAATSVAGRSSKFGVPVDVALDALVDRARRWPWLRALHHHIGSQGMAAEDHARAARVVAELRRDLHQRLGRDQFDTVDVGGGLTTDYTGQAPTLPGDVAHGIVAAFDGHAPTTLVTEYGRAVHANCGWVLTDVEYTKQPGGVPMAIVHVGADMFLRPVYDPDQWQHRFSRVDARGEVTAQEPVGVVPGRTRADRATDAPEAGPWTISGPLCFAGDVIAREVDLGPVAPGDRLVVHDVGAYTISMWSRHCSRGIPKVVGYRVAPDGSVSFELLRRRESPADVVALWSRD